MVQISDKITLIPLSNVKYCYNSTIALYDAVKILTYVSCNPIQFSQTSENSENGLAYKQSLRSIAPKSAAHILKYNGRYIIAQLTLMDRTNRFIGTKDIPAKVTITPYENNFLVQVDRLSLTPITF